MKLQLDKVTFSRGGRSILTDVSMSLESGELRFVVGPSGAGKSTLLRLVAGFETPDSGQVQLGQAVVARDGEMLVPPGRRFVGMAFQDGALWPHMTVQQHLCFGLDARMENPREREDWLDKILALVSLNGRGRDRPGQLSGGERQRLGLARALSLDAKLLLLDEPLAHLDWASQRALATDLGRWLAARETTVLWVTHRVGEIAMVPGASVGVLTDGTIERDLPSHDVAAWLANAYES